MREEHIAYYTIFRDASYGCIRGAMYASLRPHTEVTCYAEAVTGELQPNWACSSWLEG